MALIMREDIRTGVHVSVSVWVGEVEGSRALAGYLTFREEEWDAMKIPAEGGDYWVTARAT